MKRRLPFLLVLFMLCPLQAQAKAHRCTLPDGSTQFQDTPCPSGAASAEVQPLVITPGPKHKPAPSSRERGPNMVEAANMRAQKQRDEESKAEQAEIEARNKRMRCSNAREQLSVVRTQAPVYSVDEEGNRHYIENEDRPAAIARAEQEVAEACN